MRKRTARFLANSLMRTGLAFNWLAQQCASSSGMVAKWGLKSILCALLLTATGWTQNPLFFDSSFSPPPPPAVTPTFSPGSGTYSGAQTVTISSTSGTIECWNTTGSPATNGTTGCTTGTLISTNSGTACVSGHTVCGDITVSTSETVYAVAGGTGLTDSGVGSAAYVINIVYTDNFSGSSLSGNWTAYTVGSGCGSQDWGAPSVGSAQVYNNTAGTGPCYFISYTAGTFGTNQTSQATCGALSYDCAHGGVGIHMSTSGNGYTFQWPNTGSISKWTAGVATPLTSTGTCSTTGVSISIGDVVKIANVGSTITFTDTTTGANCIATDSTYTGGAPGLAGFGSQFGIYTAWSTWSGF